MNKLYDYGRNEFLKANIDWLQDTIRAVLLPATFTPDLLTDRFLSDIPEDDWISISEPLSAKTAEAGVAGAEPTRCVAVLGPEVASLVLFMDTGLSSTSPLIAYIDVADNLPITPEGANLIIRWNSNLIFKL